jgi:thioredoxin reductase (NADPH)
MKNKNTYDVAIVGAGPAGLTAAIYARRYNLSCVVIGQKIGGLITEAHVVENYPGFTTIKGIDLMEKFVDHAKSVGATIVNGLVINIKNQQPGESNTGHNNFILTVENGEQYQCKTLILALGTNKKKLNVENEDKFLGKGISYCYTCDAAFFRGKTVSVIGGADSAA